MKRLLDASFIHLLAGVASGGTASGVVGTAASQPQAA